MVCILFCASYFHLCFTYYSSIKNGTILSALTSLLATLVNVNDKKHYNFINDNFLFSFNSINIVFFLYFSRFGFIMMDKFQELPNSKVFKRFLFMIQTFKAFNSFQHLKF